MTEQDIEGRWELLSWRQEYDDGRVILPMGEEVTGFVDYRDGNVTIMIMDSTRPNFKTGGQWDATDAEKAKAYESGLFYAGTFEVHGDTVHHNIEMATFPNWVGGTQKRLAELDGDKLRLIARLEADTPEARRAILEWRRAGKHKSQ